MKYIIIGLFLTTACALETYATEFKVTDSLGYRYYHDMDNEHDGSKLRMYVGKKFYNQKLKLAYERKRTGRGIEAGTWFIDHSIKF